MRDFDGRTYFKAENGAILFGGFEALAKPWGMKGIPKDFKFTEVSEDWEQFSPFMECGLQRFPDLETAEIRHLSNVAESFTPDNAFMVGEAPGIKNFFVGCGMNSVGIASAAGCGRALAQRVDQGYPEGHLWPVDIRRYFQRVRVRSDRHSFFGRLLFYRDRSGYGSAGLRLHQAPHLGKCAGHHCGRHPAKSLDTWSPELYTRSSTHCDQPPASSR